MKRILTGIVVAGALVVGTASATSLGSFTDVTFAASDVELQPCEADDVNVLPASVADSTFGVFGVGAVEIVGLVGNCAGKFVDLAFVGSTTVPGVPIGVPGCEIVGSPPAAGAYCADGPGTEIVNRALDATITTTGLNVCFLDAQNYADGHCQSGSDTRGREVLSVQRGLRLGGLGTQVLTFAAVLPLDIEAITDVEIVVYDSPSVTR